MNGVRGGGRGVESSSGEEAHNIQLCCRRSPYRLAGGTVVGTACGGYHGW